MGAATDYDLTENDEDDEDGEDDEESVAEEGPVLRKSDFAAIGAAKSVARLLLASPDITPQQIVGLGHALYGLEQVPEFTSSVDCEFGVRYYTGGAKHNRTECILFSIREEGFEIMTGGSVYDDRVGSDSIAGPGWLIESGGFISRDLGSEVYEMEDTIRHYLELGAEIIVKDASGNVDMGED